MKREQTRKEGTQIIVLPILLVGITGTGSGITRGPFKPTGTNPQPLQKTADIVRHLWKYVRITS